ncbi:cation diffusion facilitator family transporter [Armatimonas sp.]|uniref:cation diffusion facilitator family transporter n=1 Tax=Armatimonas sp. TaxID=1872638 RepID=UPI00286A31F1|nr:cation diffusion facilitator family transporter [Armatimonas sp.]
MSTPHPAEQGMRSTLIGIGVNLFLSLGKLLAGVFGHSYALVADAIESGMDVLSSILVYFGLKVSTLPADENHPQGHGKAEPLAAVMVAFFLFIAAIGIAYTSIQRIRVPHRLPAPWTLLVLLAVVIIKEALVRFSLRVGEQTGSNAVKADALHQRTDTLTSIAAFLGITVALIGSHFHPDPRWPSADDWAALMASVVIFHNGIGILRGALFELTDAHPDPALEAEVRRIALTVVGVENLHKCFIRKMGFDYFVELDVRVAGELSVYRGHEIAHEVQDTVRAQISDKRFARVLVHIEPTFPKS